MLQGHKKNQLKVIEIKVLYLSSYNHIKKIWKEKKTYYYYLL